MKPKFWKNIILKAGRSECIRLPASTYIKIMAVTTTVYLLAELGFNARLLQITGGFPDTESVNAIERWGRVISGVALGLLLWAPCLHVLLKRRYRLPVNIVVFFLIFGLSLYISWFGEKALLDNLVNNSNGETRRTFARLSMFNNGIISSGKGDISEQELHSPEGKAYISLFTIMAAYSPEMIEKASTALSSAVSSAISEAAGSVDDGYTKFRQSVDGLHPAYKEYLKATELYKDTINSIPRKQNEAWAKYELNLAEHHLSPERVGGMRRGIVVREVKNSGVPVPDNWNPSDRYTFNSAIAGKVHKEADSAFIAETNRRGLSGIKAGLSFECFLLVPGVISEWKKGLGLPESSPAYPGMSKDMWQKQVFQPMKNKRSAEEIKYLSMPASAYSDMGALERKGRKSAEAALVPPMALFFSLLGALTHLFKSSRYLMMLLWRPKIKPNMFDDLRNEYDYAKNENTTKRFELIRTLVLAFIIVVPTGAVFWIENSVSRSESFSYMESGVRNSIGFIPALALKWVIQVEPIAWPLFEGVRRTVLFGYGFGTTVSESVSAVPVARR